MRDVLLIAIILGLSGIALFRPWIGALAWAWISIMNPHQYSWRAASMPVAAMVAGATLVGLVITRDKRQVFVTRESAFLILFMIWISITYQFSPSSPEAFEMWSRIMKIDLMILVTLVLLHSRRHIELFIWVLVFSLGFYGVKGGIFTIATGGSYRVWGPGGFIGGNNEIALALIMIIPLMRYLQLQAGSAWVSRGLTIAMILTAIAALGSHSRGALLGMAAMATYIWVKSPRKVIFGGGMFLVGAAIVLFMPDEWGSRMNTISSYDEDASAMGRINAWWMAWNLARARFFGGGFEIYTPEMFGQYAPDPLDVHAAHSIYFQVLGEHGFVGILIFVGMWFFVWRSAGRLSKKAVGTPGMRWCGQLSEMCQASLLGYAVGGAFLSLAYFDLPYNLLIIVVLTMRCFDKGERAIAPTPKAAPNTNGAIHPGSRRAPLRV